MWCFGCYNAVAKAFRMFLTRCYVVSREICGVLGVAMQLLRLSECF